MLQKLGVLESDHEDFIKHGSLVESNYEDSGAASDGACASAVVSEVTAPAASPSVLSASAAGACTAAALSSTTYMGGRGPLAWPFILV